MDAAVSHAHIFGHRRRMVERGAAAPGGRRVPDAGRRRARGGARRAPALDNRPVSRSARIALGGLVALAALAAAPASAGAARPEVRVERTSGAVTIAVRGAVLRESTARGAGPGGRLGFLAGGRWYHARRLLRAHRRSYVLATDDPAGRRIRLETGAGRRGATLAAGVLGGPVEAVGIGFDARRGERMLGFGERSDHVDQRGNVVESYVGEGPYQESEYAVPRATVPPWGLRERSDASYYPMPWLLSTRGYGVLVGNLETSRFRLAAEDPGEWSVEADAQRLELRVFAGPEPADAVRRMSAATGRQPKPDAPWLLGPWVQTGHQNTEPDELAHVRALRAADAPLSAVETHMRYMPCGADQGHEAAERERTAGLHAEGLAVLTYTREAICASYPAAFDPAVAADAFLERADGSPYTFPTFVGSGVTQVGMLDFTDPDAARVYRSILDRAYAAGYDGWMEDYGEYAPPDSIADNGMTGARMHNRYPVVYHREGRRYSKSKGRPIIRFNRSGFSGAARYSQVVWGGDPTTGWGFDGLASAVKEALTMGLSGVSLWGSDIGGFFTLSDQRLTPELLARWIELGAFSGVMRTKAEGIGVPLSARPQVWEQPTLPLWRRYAKLRTQLYPYLQAADAAYRRTGMPIMRQLALAYPGDRRATGSEDEFLFGDDLLVAPVLAPGARSRRLYVPDGRWIDFWKAVAYRPGSDGSFALGRARVIAGGRQRTVPAPLEQVPLMARAGTLLPLLPADVETLAPYAAADHVGLDDSRGELHVIALPRGRSAAGFGTRGRLVCRERAGSFSLRIDPGGRRATRLDLEASTATLRRPFRPRGVELDGHPVARSAWSYRRRSRVLKLSLRVPAGGTIEVRR